MSDGAFRGTEPKDRTCEMTIPARGGGDEVGFRGKELKMGRPKGSKNRPADKGDDFGDNSGELRDGVSDKELHDYIDRIEALNKDQAEISADRQQVFKELKQAGYNRGTVGAIIERRKLTAEERDTADALMDQYMAALGDFAGTPLGEAGAGRVRGEVHIAA